MATDVESLRRAVRQEGRRRHDLAARRLVNDLSRATPVVTGRLERARRRRDTSRGDVFVATITQRAGAGEPADLPRWLDEGVEFTIRPVRARALRFRPRGSRPIFRMSARWRPRPGSIGFWSRTMTAVNWRRALESTR